MSVVIERDHLLPAINAASRLSDKGRGIPILSHVLLSPGAAVLNITGTDISRRLDTKIAAQTNGSQLSATTVAADPLLRILNGLPAGAHISLDWGTEDSRLDLKCGRSRYKLHTLRSEDYPGARVLDNADEFSIGAEDLTKALKFVGRFAQPDRSRPYLAGAFVHVGDDTHHLFGPALELPRLIFVATNSRELARYSMPLPAGADLPKNGSEASRGVILPEETIDEIIRFVGQGKDEVRIEAADNAVSFESAHGLLSTVLVDGTYPGYLRALPSEIFSTAIVDADALASALLRLCALGKPRARFEIDNGVIKLSGTDTETGSADEVIEAEYEGPAVTLSPNPRSLLAALETLDCDVVQLRIFLEDQKNGFVLNAIKNDAVDYARMTLSMAMLT